MVVTGILHSYIFGTFCDWRTLCIACAVPCCIYFIGMIFQNESPTYLITKSKTDEANKVLQKLRGTSNLW